MKITVTFFFIICSTALLFAQDSYEIGILLDDENPATESLLDKLKTEIKSVVGEDALIVFPEDKTLVSRRNPEKAAANYNSLLNNGTDIILAFGPLNSKIITNQKNHKVPTILFGAINRDFGLLGDTKTSSSGIPNFNYLIDSQSFKADLEKFRELSGFSQVSIAIDEALLKELPYEKVFDTIAEELGISYSLIPYTDGANLIAQIGPDIESFYLAEGFSLKDSDIKTIAELLIKDGIPSFTTTGPNHVALGFMATNRSISNLDRFFRRIALNVESHINGQELSHLPTYIVFENDLTVNYNTSELVGLPFKYSQIHSTHFVGELTNPLAKKRYNLTEVMQLAITQNLSLNSSKKDVALAEQDYKTAISNYFPDITATASGVYIDPDLAEISNGQNPEYSTSGNITATQVIYSEDATANIGIQKSLLNSEREDYNSQELDVVFDVCNAYFNALILKANLQIQNQNLELTKKNLEISRLNFEAGQSGKTDLLRFRSELAQNTQSVVEAINSLKQSYFVLNQLLNNPIDFEIDVDDADLGEGVFENYNYQELRDLLDTPYLRKQFVEYLIHKAKGNAPELKSLDHNLKAVKRSIRLNGSGRFVPTLALEGQYNRDFNQWGIGSTPEPIINSNYSVGLNLSLPIFQQNQKNINRQIAVIQKDQLSINKENLELNIESNINSIVLQLINDIANIEISKVSEKTAKENLEITQASYNNGAVTIIQLLDSQNNYLQTQQSKANAIYNFLLSTLQMERYISYYFLLHTAQENNEFIQGFYSFIQNKNQ